MASINLKYENYLVRKEKYNKLYSHYISENSFKAKDRRKEEKKNERKPLFGLERNLHSFFSMIGAVISFSSSVLAFVLSSPYFFIGLIAGGVLIIVSEGSDYLFTFVKDWREIESTKRRKRFRIIGKEGEYKVQVKFLSKWFTLKEKEVLPYGFFDEMSNVDMIFQTQYEAQEFVTNKKEILKKKKEEQEQERLRKKKEEQERNRVIGEF